MLLQISAGISEKREAGGMRFGKSVKSKRGDGKNDLFLRFLRDAVTCHAGAKFGFDLAHALFRPLESHGAAQFFSFAAGEPGDYHRHA